MIAQYYNKNRTYYKETGPFFSLFFKCLCLCLFYTLRKEKNSSDTNIPNNHKTHTTQKLINYIHAYSHTQIHIIQLFTHNKKHDIHI